MAFLPSFLMALVVTSFGPGGSLGCNLPPNHILLSRENLVLLAQMRRISLYLCWDDIQDFRFPQKVVDGSHFQKTQAICVLHEMLCQTSRVFLTLQSSAAWNTTLVGKFHNILHRQLEDLNTYLVQEMGQAERVLVMKDPTLTVKRYFQGNHFYLKEKKYSYFAWDIVREEVMRPLFLSTNLQDLLKKDGDLGHL